MWPRPCLGSLRWSGRPVMGWEEGFFFRSAELFDEGGEEDQFLARNRVAIDLATGFGADSALLRKGPRDPWARHCFAMLIDAVLNYDEVHFTLAPFLARESLQSPDFLPVIFEVLREQGWLQFDEVESEQELHFHPDQLDHEYLQFSNWVVVGERQKVKKC